MPTNWAGNHTYRAERIESPTSIAELQDLVAHSPRVRALGSGHTFTALPDTTGTLVRLDALPPLIEVDPDARTVAVSGGVRYGELAVALHHAGWSLPNLASLPHISVAGAVATGTHGSGERNGTLSSSVCALDLVGPDGTLRTVRRGDPDFAGSVVAIGALGVVTRLVLDVAPTFDVTSTQYTGLGWSALDEVFDDLMSAAYSVSLFTHWTGGIEQVWVKATEPVPPGDLLGATPATETLHMLAGAPAEAVTEQHGVRGPWHERLPHFRMEFTPSRGEELQSEYFVPREQARAAFAALRPLGERLAPVLQVSEVRAIAADDLWLSGCYGRDTVGLHFTWDRDEPAVRARLPLIEEALVPLGARPHWGKCFTMPPADVAAAFPRAADFAALVHRVDPTGTFTNDLVDAWFGAAG